MAKWNEALHPRGHGGKFSSGGKGGGKAEGPRGFNRKERNDRAKQLEAGLRAQGVKRGTAKAVARGNKEQDKGKVVLQDGQAFRVNGRKNQKAVAAIHRQEQTAAPKKAAPKKPAARKPAARKPAAPAARKKR